MNRFTTKITGIRKPEARFWCEAVVFLCQIRGEFGITEYSCLGPNPDFLCSLYIQIHLFCTLFQMAYSGLESTSKMGDSGICLTGTTEAKILVELTVRDGRCH